VEVEERLKAVAEQAQEIKDALLCAVDEDTRAFNAYMQARRLPAKTKEQSQIKKQALQKGLKTAVEVPLETARKSLTAIELAGLTAESGNINSVSDAGVGAFIAYSGVKGGIFNVLINLKDIEDREFVQNMRETCREIDRQAQEKVTEILEIVTKKINTLMSANQRKKSKINNSDNQDA
jgi:formiminotetrahydrofolate cyclodeaminase